MKVGCAPYSLMTRFYNIVFKETKMDLSYIHLNTLVICYSSIISGLISRGNRSDISLYAFIDDYYSSLQMKPGIISLCFINGIGYRVTNSVT